MIEPEKLPLRLIIAVALIVLGVGTFILIGHLSNTVSNVAAPEKPAPAVSMPKLPKSAPQPASSPKAAQSAPRPASSPTAAQSAPAAVETPPAPVVSNVAPAVRHKPVVHEKPKTVAAKKTAKSGKMVKKGGFTLQFGVFSSGKNSERMASTLRKKGLEPVLNTLVLSGPYPDRKAALKDRKSGAILVVRQGKYLLQFGDFESSLHATHLAEELQKKGIQVHLVTRVRAGRYESRKAALGAARKLGIAAIAVRR